MSVTDVHTKECPTCHTTVDAAITRCACGYHFATATDEDESSYNLVAQAEALYETHLRARLQRARRGLKLAKIDRLRDPNDTTRKAQLREAEKEVELLETQVDVQSARVADARATTASETFHATQSIKAERSLELARLQEKLSGADASGAFNIAQAGKARDVVQQTNATQNCSACGASIATGAARCACGRRVTASEGAAEFLSTEELAALRGNP